MSSSDPDPRDFVVFGILHSGFFRDFAVGIFFRGFFEVLLSRSPEFREFRDFQIPILIPVFLGFSGFFDLAQIKKFHPEANSDHIQLTNLVAEWRGQNRFSHGNWKGDQVLFEGIFAPQE